MGWVSGLADLVSVEAEAAAVAVVEDMWLHRLLHLLHLLLYRRRRRRHRRSQSQEMAEGEGKVPVNRPSRNPRRNPRRNLTMGSQRTRLVSLSFSFIGQYMAFLPSRVDVYVVHLPLDTWRSGGIMVVFYPSCSVEYMAFRSYYARLYIIRVSLTISDSPPRLKLHSIKPGFSRVRVPAVIRRLMSFAECLEELETTRAYSAALQQALDDIIKDHPDIRKPDIDPADKGKGKGEEPCKDNGDDTRDKQHADQIKELLQQLEDAKKDKDPGTDCGTQTTNDDLVHTKYAHCIDEMKQMLDTIKTLPRDCLDNQGNLKPGPSGPRPPKTDKTLSEQLHECKSELQKHGDPQNGCEAKTQKLTDQLKQCQTENAKNAYESKTDMEQLCQEQLDAQKKALDAEHQKALDDARTVDKIDVDAPIRPGDKLTIKACTQRVSELQGQLDLSQAYCHSKPGEAINLPDQGKGSVQKISKRQVDDEEGTGEGDEDWTSDAETAAEDASTLQDDPTAGNSSRPSISDIMGLEYNPPAECNDFLKGCHIRVGDLKLQVDQLKAEHQDKTCQAFVDTQIQERDKFWQDTVEFWKTGRAESDARAVKIGEKFADLDKKCAKKCRPRAKFCNIPFADVLPRCHRC